jgi:protein-disulfide isomerase
VNRKFFTLMGAVAVTVFSALPAAAQDNAASEITPEYVNTLIGDYIKNNPEEILASLEQHQIDQAARAEEVAAETYVKNKDYFESDAVETVGNENADVKVIEFFDYNCGYCKRAFTDIQTLLDKDKNVEVVFVEMPILGPTSLTAAKWALAAAKQDKYFEFHAALMKYPGQKNESSLEKLAEEVGLDVAQLKEDANDEELLANLEKNLALAREMGISGTPGFIVNGEVYRGYLGYDGLQAVIEEARLAQENNAATSEDNS